MLDNETFKIVIKSAPLISIDFLVKKDKKILLGRRINKPAQNYYFSIGGRIYKNESINNAMARIALNELNIELESTPKFIGVFEHFYDESIYEALSTHYVNMAFEYEVKEIRDLPKEQHVEYKWFTIDGLLRSNEVHNYTKGYFRN